MKRLAQTIAMLWLAAAALLANDEGYNPEEPVASQPTAAYTAAYVGERAFYDPSPADDWLEINPHVSVGISSIVQNYGNVVQGLSDFLLSPGCMMRAGVDIRFNIRNSFGIATGIDFGINNHRFAMSVVSPSTGTISSLYVSSHYYDFTVPVYAQGRFHLGRKVMWSASLGAYFSEGLGGTLKANGYASGENSLGQPIVTSVNYKTGYYDSSQPLINSVERFDWGPRIATGLIFNKRITFDCILQVSARNLAKNTGMLPIKYRNLSLNFQLGWIF